MARNRFQTACEEGIVAVPPGSRVTLLRAPGDWPLAGLEEARISVAHTFFPEAARWEARGFEVTPEPTPADLAVVVTPRSRTLARALVAQAATAAPVVVVDGQRTDGVDALWREMRVVLGDLPAVTMGHGRLFVARPEDRLADWAMGAPRMGAEGFHTLPGVFSEGRVDPGSRLLAEALPDVLPAHMADLGAGWGYLSQAVLARNGVESIALIEAESLALDCARLNISDPRATFHWGDALTFRPARPFDGVIMNPPFHHGRTADPELGRAFIRAAQGMLAPNGQLWMVSNRHLPYQDALDAAFRRVERIGPESGGFVLHHAALPRRPEKRERRR